MDNDTFITGTYLIEQKPNTNNKSTETKDLKPIKGEQKPQKKQVKINQKIPKKTSNNDSNNILNNLNNRSFKGKNQKVMTNLEKAEEAYRQIKIDDLLNAPDTEDGEEIPYQNSKMLDYFNQLNKIVTFLTENSKVATKANNPKSQNSNSKVVNPSVNNDKIINRYKKDNENIDKKLKKYNDPEYKIKVEMDRNKLSEEIKNLEKENKELENQQKLTEIQIAKLSKGGSRENQLKKVSMDLNKRQIEYEKLMKKLKKKGRKKLK